MICLIPRGCGGWSENTSQSNGHRRTDHRSPDYQLICGQSPPGQIPLAGCDKVRVYVSAIDCSLRSSWRPLSEYKQVTYRGPTFFPPRPRRRSVGTSGNSAGKLSLLYIEPGRVAAQLTTGWEREIRMMFGTRTKRKMGL